MVQRVKTQGNHHAKTLLIKFKKLILMDLEKLRYPIGKFNSPKQITPEFRKEFIKNFNSYILAFQALHHSDHNGDLSKE